VNSSASRSLTSATRNVPAGDAQALFEQISKAAQMQHAAPQPSSALAPPDWMRSAATAGG
jgi:hypothetical protein